MIDTALQESADEFVRVLAASPVVSAFRESKASMVGDEELSALRDQHARLAEEFRTKQFDGTLTQEDISKQRTLYKRVTTHPANIRFVAARDEALELLRSCNHAMSGLLGFDFAANAAPAASC
jgi:cell fate (sporulation/competence/biofilm development) regulator YlbF (YheA/YmcA/DUF963 family)